MLVLKRKVGESIVIDGIIEVKVLSTGRNVYIGTAAPDHISVMRKELLDTQDKNTKNITKAQAKKWGLLL